MVSVQRAVREVEEFLAGALAAADADSYVLGVSGGLDSAVAATLATRSVGSDAVVGLILPSRPSDEEHMADARELCGTLGVEYHEFSIDPIVDAVEQRLPFGPGRITLGNVRARTRMVVEYAVANERECLVLGTSNRSERLLGYVTKYGDAAADVQPLQDLYKTEVADVASHVGLDRRFVEKTPTAGLWEGQTDEGEIGVPYETIDEVLPPLVEEGLSPRRVAERTGVDAQAVRHLAALWRASEHKRSPPASPGLRE
jgi:NAD+ synthase